MVGRQWEELPKAIVDVAGRRVGEARSKLEEIDTEELAERTVDGVVKGAKWAFAGLATAFWAVVEEIDS